MSIDFTPLRSEHTFSLLSKGEYPGVIMDAGARVLPATGETYYEITWSLDQAESSLTFKEWIHAHSSHVVRQESARRKLTALCDVLGIKLQEGEKNALDAGLFLGQRATVMMDVFQMKDGKNRNVIKGYRPFHA